jgi:2-polyprenyl-3-methyl-5-hydroxy-6-metoxy-1,4-benzoquinol methylase
MLFNQEDEIYINGSKFTEDLYTSYQFEPEDYLFQSRHDILTALSSGKKVIHIGCVDHNIEMIERKLKAGIWLHKLLSDVATRCFGIDIKKDEVEYIRDQLGYKDIEVVDILTQESEALKQEQWDYALLPEVLEHIGNPVAFLTALNTKLKNNVNELVISVPNAFYRGNFKHASKGIERINSDHRFWFTPYTLAKLVTDSGFKVSRILFTNVGTIGKLSFLRRKYYERHPMLRNNIILICRFQ